MNSTAISFIPQTAEDESIDSEAEDQKYFMYSRTGFLRNLNKNIIDIEQVPTKRSHIKIPNYPIKDEPRAHIQEIFDIKSRLARRGIQSNFKDIELGLHNKESKSFSVPLNLLPKVGQSLINNPFIKLKSKSKDKKKKKSKKNKKNNK